jgi:hypothetical protein
MAVTLRVFEEPIASENARRTGQAEVKSADPVFLVTS